jgi:hypothetical protein
MTTEAYGHRKKVTTTISMHKENFKCLSNVKGRAHSKRFGQKRIRI